MSSSTKTKNSNDDSDDEGGSEEPVIEHFKTNECFVYKVNPTAGGLRAGDWNLEKPFLTGSLKLASKGETIRVNIYNLQGALAASCPITLHEDPENLASKLEYWVEQTKDSSRYFGVRVVDPKSQRSMILGVGFRERNVAFEFQSALGDHFKRVRRLRDAAKGKGPGMVSILPSSRGEDEEEEEEEGRGARESGSEGKEATGNNTPPSMSRLTLKAPIKLSIKSIASGGAGGHTTSATTATDNNGDTKSILLPPPPEVQPYVAPPPSSTNTTNGPAAKTTSTSPPAPDIDVDWGDFQ